MAGVAPPPKKKLLYNKVDGPDGGNRKGNSTLIIDNGIGEKSRLGAIK